MLISFLPGPARGATGRFTRTHHPTNTQRSDFSFDLEIFMSEEPVTHIDLSTLREQVDTTIDRFLEEIEKDGHYSPIVTPIRVLRNFLKGGGKRVRPLFFCLGWLAVSEKPVSADLLRKAAGLELFHAFALIHDDLIDDSLTRRGLPAVHHVFPIHSPDPLRGKWFGESAALLLGDLCIALSVQLMGHLGHSNAREIADRMRIEMLAGQYLDMCSFGQEISDPEHAMTVIYYKTTKYTVERPLQLGAALAGATNTALKACADYAGHLGAAFQIFDDLEDVLVPPYNAARGNDLREGKHTAVIALALHHADNHQRARLLELVGQPPLDKDEFAEAQDLIVATGAIAEARRMVIERQQSALDVLASAPFRPAAKRALVRLSNLALPGVAEWRFQ